MGIRLKPLARQVVVITGATSGHGLCAARKAARKGARVVLAARDEVALIRVVEEIRESGGTAEYVVTDVGSESDMHRLSEQAIARFGGYDSWINNAGTGIYAAATQVPLDDHRRLFETNYWGVVHGSMIALDHLKSRGGGAIVNVGSINSDMGSPLLSSYVASKHAVKGFTDSLRIELIEAKIPISLTLIKPSAIGTPFPQHGRNLTGFKARLPIPIYKPDLVADAILEATERPRRAVTVGGAGKFQVLGATLVPSVFDRVAALMTDLLIDRSRPVPRIDGNLHAPQGNDGCVEGDQRGRGFSTIAPIRRHPRSALLVLTTAILGGAMLGKRRLSRRMRGRKPRLFT